MAAPSSIASCGKACSALFPLLVGSLEEKLKLQNQLSSDAVKDESKRFELWGKNIAALQDANLPSSLEHRLRDDASARGIVLKALLYLEESLQMALSIASGERENEFWDLPPAEPEPEEEPTLSGGIPNLTSSELKELGLAIQEGITNLFRLSMIIRKKPERDEYLKASLTYTFDSTADIIHVGDKYPVAKKGDKWLMERLGTAITRRRQYLLYRKEHQEKMEQIHTMYKGVDGKTVWSGEKASTYHPNDTLEDSRPIDLSVGVFNLTARTEYADSSKGKDGASNLLRTPLLPKGSNGVRVDYNQHFECPYCRRPQRVQDKDEWKKHVFGDLRPYVCTFNSCGLNMFESQNLWFEHEMRFHRKQWTCQFCEKATTQTRSSLQEHMTLTHADKVHESQPEALLDACQVSRIRATECPLCIEYGVRFQKINQSERCDVSLKQFQEHLGRHMEQLALSALPQEEIDENEGLASGDAESFSSTATSTVQTPVNEEVLSGEQEIPDEHKATMQQCAGCNGSGTKSMVRQQGSQIQNSWVVCTECNNSEETKHDSQPRIYTCDVLPCKGLQFGSSEIFRNHERKNHSIYTYGDEPFLCYLSGCEEGTSGNGFPRYPDLCEHIRRVHNVDPGPLPRYDNVSAGESDEGALHASDDYESEDLPFNHRFDSRKDPLLVEGENGVPLNYETVELTAIEATAAAEKKAAGEKLVWEQKLIEEQESALLNYEAAQKKAAEDSADGWTKFVEESDIRRKKLQQEKAIAILKPQAASTAATAASEVDEPINISKISKGEARGSIDERG